MNPRKLIVGIGAVCLLSFPLLAQNLAPYYVLDGYGGVHAGGGAPTISPPTFYFGWDIAKAIDFVPVAYSSSIYGDGVFVLDGYGGIHKGGKLSGLSTTPTTAYFGWNIARDIVYRLIDPQAYGTSDTATSFAINSSTKTVLTSFYINMPDAGYVLLTASAACWNGSANDVATGYGIGIDDSTTIDQRTERWNALPTGNIVADHYQTDAINTSVLTYLTEGQHYFYFLAWRRGGTGTSTIRYPTLMAVYVNKDYKGYSRIVEPDPAVMPTPASQPSTDGMVK